MIFSVAFSNDKLILKVVAQSEALLGLVALGPEFVSQNEHDGRIECDVIFPLGFTSISEEEMEAEMKLDDTFGAEDELDEENVEKQAESSQVEETPAAEPAAEPPLEFELELEPEFAADQGSALESALKQIPEHEPNPEPESKPVPDSEAIEQF